MYENAYITNAIPIADWRIDVENDIKDAFAEIGEIDSVRSNDGGPRPFRCALPDISDFDVRVYLWKDHVEIRWSKYKGENSKSEWIQIADSNVNGANLASKVKVALMKMNEERMQ